MDQTYAPSLLCSAVNVRTICSISSDTRPAFLVRRCELATDSGARNHGRGPRTPAILSDSSREIST